MSFHVFDNAFICATVVSHDVFQVPKSFSFVETKVETKRPDLKFLSRHEQFVLPQKKSQNKCMERITTGHTGETYFSLKPTNSRPNVITIILESGRFDEWTDELKIKDFESQNKCMERITTGHTGETYFSLKPTNSRPNVITIILESGRFDEWTDDLKIKDFEPSMMLFSTGRATTDY
eukprot:Awhi_evm1s6679